MPTPSAQVPHSAGSDGTAGSHGTAGSGGSQPRFLTLPDVAEILNTTLSQVRALVRRGELPAIKLGGRGQWRVETAQLEAFIQRMYAETREYVATQPDLAELPADALD